MSSYTKQERALAAHFSLKGNLEEQISQPHAYDSDVYAVEGEPGEYRVLTSEERDEAINAAVEPYIDDVILPETPEAYRGYFDSASFRRDIDCAGEGDSMISPYDGNVHEECVDGEWFYIIREN